VSHANGAYIIFTAIYTNGAPYCFRVECSIGSSVVLLDRSVLLTTPLRPLVVAAAWWQPRVGRHVCSPHCVAPCPMPGEGADTTVSAYKKARPQVRFPVHLGSELTNAGLELYQSSVTPMHNIFSEAGLSKLVCSDHALNLEACCPALGLELPLCPPRLQLVAASTERQKPVCDFSCMQNGIGHDS